MEIQNTKTSTAFWKIGKHLEKDNVNNFIFLRIESMFPEAFPKNTNQYFQHLTSLFSNYIHHSVFTFIIQYLPSSFIISILSIYLHSLLDKESVRFNPASFLEKYEHYFGKFTCYYILCILCHETYPLNFVIILPYMAESS